MRSILIYDLPTRLFHWIFSGLFLFSFIIAQIVDDENLVFCYHMLSGLMLGGIVIWRLFWGIVGTKNARFAGFNLNPLDLKDYFMSILSGSKKRWSGHNPASSWAALLMLALGLGLSVSGYLMTSTDKETFEDIHELMAYSFIVIVILHITGVVLHSLRHQDGLFLSMIDGKKELTESRGEIQSSRKFAGLILIVLVVLGGFYLYKNFDGQNRSLSLLGTTLQLGEKESKNENSENETEENESRPNLINNINDNIKTEDGDDD